MRPGRASERRTADNRRRIAETTARLRAEVYRPGWRDWLAGFGLALILIEILVIAEVLR